MDINIILFIALIVLMIASVFFYLFKDKIKEKANLTNEQMKAIEEAISEAVDTVNRLYKAKDPDERKRIAIDIAYEKIVETGIKIDRAFLEQLVGMIEKIDFKK